MKKAKIFIAALALLVISSALYLYLHDPGYTINTWAVREENAAAFSSITSPATLSYLDIFFPPPL